MSEPTKDKYDAVRYPGFALPQTHPDRLATLATLFSMSPAPVTNCRVLELACGDGSNLIPMALSLPECSFVGVDLAAEPIRIGQKTIGDLGLRNVELVRMDVRNLPAEWGEFDYIIAHGLYSWAPPDVRDRVLELCGRQLAHHGVAYISYNTFPGSHLRQMVRDMLLFHTRGVDEPEQKISNALDFLTWMTEAQSGSDAYNSLVRGEIERVRGSKNQALLYHDDMSEVSAPVTFTEFIRHAERHGLQYLAEADFFEMQDHIYPPAVRSKLKALAAGDLIDREQYLDFIKCRRFRQTLLCRARLPLTREIPGIALVQFSIASAAVPSSAAPDLSVTALEEFRGPHGAAMKTDHRLTRAAMHCLAARWPHAVPFAELARSAFAMLDGPGVDPERECAHNEDAGELAALLLQTYSAGLIELHLHEPDYAATVRARPRLNALALRQALQGHTVLTNARHMSVEIQDEMGLRLVRLLDGTRDRCELTAALVAAAVEAEDASSATGESNASPHDISEQVARALEVSLTVLARSALLVD